MNDKNALSKEKAEALADELIAGERSARDDGLDKVGRVLSLLLQEKSLHVDEPNRFASPASPLWGVFHRETDTTKIGR